jgi:hypothetical protein
MSEEIVIGETTTHTLSSDLRLGCGNLWEEKDKGASAGIWVIHNKNAAANTTMRVMAGQEFDVPGFHLKVLKVVPRLFGTRGSVKLEVLPAAS